MAVKFEGGETKVENKVIRIGLRIIAGAIVSFYAGYGIYSKVTTGEVNLNAGDYTFAGIAIAILIAIESVRYYVKKKLGDTKE